MEDRDTTSTIQVRIRAFGASTVRRILQLSTMLHELVIAGCWQFEAKIGSSTSEVLAA